MDNALSDAELNAIAGLHKHRVVFGESGFCDACSEDWPCTIARIADTARAARSCLRNIADRLDAWGTGSEWSSLADIAKLARTVLPGE